MVSKRQKKAKKRFREQSSDGNQIVDDAQARKSDAPKKKATKTGKQLKAKPAKNLKKPLRKQQPLSCYKCKATDHTLKNCPKKAESEICLLCRDRGHIMKECPNPEAQKQTFCYNCGETGHRLARCSKPIKEGGTTFARCFLCKEKGHLAKNCPTQKSQIIKGHQPKNRPTKKLQISKDASLANKQKVVFKSGDDLEDDFEGL